MASEEITGLQTKQVSRTSAYLQSLNDKHIIAIPILMIIVAELLIFSAHLKEGIILHVFTLIMLALSSIWIPDSHTSRSLQVLILLPVLRLLNTSMPVFSDVTLDLYAYIYMPMLLPAYIVTKHQGLDLSKIGLRSKKFLRYIPIAVIVGAFIAIGEFMTIRAGNLIPDMSLFSLLKLSIIMVFVVGFVEELVFRSLLQTRLEDSFGTLKALIIASLLFGVMHSGYGTIYEILYIFFVGLVLGYMFQRTNSLPLVTLTHGFVNIFLFGVIPLLPYFKP